MPSQLSAGKLMAIEVATRTTSVFSVLGSAFIISTFVWFPFFRKPINRLVFFATFGNLSANIATLISVSAIPSDPDHLSGLCEFQGVLIQWFMMADSLWVFCMALNVYLVFFHGYDSLQLRYLEKWYLLFAYGVPAIPALLYVILDHNGHRVLGSATIWCWVAKDVDWMRIVFFYAPVWMMVTATLTIYIVTGIRIFKKRALLRSFAQQPNQPPVRFSDVVVANPFTVGNNIVVTTQIKYHVQQDDTVSQDVVPEADHGSISSFSSTRHLSNPSKGEEPTSTPPPAAPVIRTHQEQRESAEAGESSHQHDGNEESGYRATAFATNTTTEPTLIAPGTSPAGPVSRIKTAEGNAAAMAYLKVAFLMFIALFVVWVPSTINRLYQFINKDQPSYGLNIISAVVLPLQGAWNAAIYIFTTSTECKRAYGVIASRLTGTTLRYQPRSDAYCKDTMTSTRETRDFAAEIALDDVLKQGERVRHSEVSSPDSMAEAQPHNQDAR